MRAASKSADAAATLRRLVAEIDAEIAKVQRVILSEQRWEQRVTTRYDTVELKDTFESEATHEDVEDYTAGVMVAQLDLAALDKGGLGRFKASELKEALQARGLETKGDKPSLFARLREALEAAEASKGGEGSRQTFAHEVVSHVLVGAEEAEARLETLLQRKRELMGEA